MKSNLWNLKSRFYQFARDLPFLRWILEGERQNLAALVSEIQCRTDRILDIGSGTGSTLDLLPLAECLVTTDRSLAMLQKAIQESPDSLPVCVDGSSLPFSDQTFHMVSCIGVSEYIREKGCFIHALSHVLKPEGLLLITIAPCNLFNILRIFLGHRLYMVIPDHWEFMIRNQGFDILGRQKSFMQRQYLCKKT